MLSPTENHSLSDVGGTSGGLGQFLLGFAMACVGGFLITHQVSVVGSYWSFWAGSSFGITFLPMLIGVAILFWNDKSTIGWILTFAGALFIFPGINRVHGGSSFQRPLGHFWLWRVIRQGAPRKTSIHRQDK
jgi:hypothetical protein